MLTVGAAWLGVWGRVVEVSVGVGVQTLLALLVQLWLILHEWRCRVLNTQVKFWQKDSKRQLLYAGRRQWRPNMTWSRENDVMTWCVTKWRHSYRHRHPGRRCLSRKLSTWYFLFGAGWMWRGLKDPFTEHTTDPARVDENTNMGIWRGLQPGLYIR